MSTLKNIEITNGRRLLHVNTAGSVDNGKSTLIGRLLFDSGGLPEDIIAKIAKKTGEEKQGQNLNLALFTDGLKEEEARGITIDVARRYVSREKVDIIIADTPGHEEFTRNMITGTSLSNATLILVDATKGIVKQNRRHAYIASLMGVENLVVLINKMDLVDYSFSKFESLVKEFDLLLSTLDRKEVHYMPISALNGDNVVSQSSNMPWYNGPSLLQHLENLSAEPKEVFNELRLIVQWLVNRTSPNSDHTEFLGVVSSGIISKDDSVISTVSRQEAKVKKLFSLQGEVNSLRAPFIARASLTPRLTLRNGDVLTHIKKALPLTRKIIAEICWMDERPLRAGNEYLIQLESRAISCTVDFIHEEVDITTFQPFESSNQTLQLNDLARIEISLAEPYPLSTFTKNKASGRIVLIDRDTNITAGAGVVLHTEREFGNGFVAVR